MKIEIVGDNCAACHATVIAFQKATAKIDSTTELCPINDIINILKRGIVQMPAIIIDGKTISTGQHYNTLEAQKLIESYIKQQQ